MRFVMLVAVLALGGTSWAERTDSTAQQWARTDLNLTLTKRFISNEKCNGSLTYFQSCVDATATANSFLKEPVSLLDQALDFEKTFAAIAAKLPPEVPVQQMLGFAITQHLNAFDAHAYIEPAEKFFPEDNYVGLGMMVRKIPRGFFVTEVIDGSAASDAKMSFGDLLTGVEGLSAEEFSAKSVNELAQVMRGPPGTTVSLSYERDRTANEIKISRAKVEAKNAFAVKFKAEPTIGYIRLREFISGQSCSLVRKSLQELEMQGVKKVILDLRGNSGGATFEALCIAGLFVGYRDLVGLKNVEVQIPERDLIRVYETSTDFIWFRGTTLQPLNTPLVVLVNTATASAAELLSGTLQYYGRAWIVGEQTFGKGSQQTYSELPENGSLILAATTQRFYFPNLMSNQRVGITPSFKIPLTLLPLGNEDLAPENEASVFPTSLPAVNDAWEDPRQDAIAKIRGCIEKDQLDMKYITQMGQASGDHQRAYGAAVLKCYEP
ncbi:MAG: S41 family peptidase [Bdellovibrionales bacterium]